MRPVKILVLSIGIGMIWYCGGCSSKIPETQLEDLKETRQASQDIREEVEKLKGQKAELSKKLQSLQHELERARAEYKRVEHITHTENTKRDSIYE